eukprot:g21892.t1
MPPADSPRPSEKHYRAILSELEARLDRASKRHPKPGRTATFRRLTRTEYANAIRDLLALKVDARKLLPPDEASHGFDNITVRGLSPTLLNRYVSAAQRISRLALGRTPTSPGGDTFRMRPDITQEDRMPGLPIGTRGGMLIPYTFPTDGEYNVEIRLARDRNEHVEGLREPHSLELLLDRKRLQLFTVEPPKGGGKRPRRYGKASHANVDRHLKARIKVSAGPHKLGVTFLKKGGSLLETKRQPLNVHFNMYRHPRLTPAIFEVSITGPFNGKGAGETPSRRRIFVCRPKNQVDEEACAARILKNLMQRAYRRPVTAADLEKPLELYRQARREGDFEAGIEMGLSAILVNPNFLFRIERAPDEIASGHAYTISDIELASRLSFFLWSSIPDDELLRLAIRGRLSDPKILEQQTRRMLADERAQALVTNFAGQWLYLRNLDAITPDMRRFPDFGDNLRQAMRRETELFFASIIREDRSVLDILQADETYLNERLAKHYRIPHIYGPRFRRVKLTGINRRGGLLRHGSILTVTSYATRTSPVIRGKWILENILGTPPPPPPEMIPALKDNTVAANLSVRERLREHRANAACATCHNLMDPVGFSLENFDAVGQWRDLEEGKPVDASGGLPDGSRFEGVAGLERGLLKRPEIFVGIGASLSLPLLDAMIPSMTALAETPASPARLRRLGYVYIPMGCDITRWTPPSAETLDKLSPSLTPLEPVKQHVSVISNLELKNAYPGTHATSNSSFLSAAKAKRTESTDYYLGTTADQIAAKQLGRSTQLPSLELAMDLLSMVGQCDNGYACVYQNNLSWSSPTTPLPAEAHPRIVFEALFGDGSSAKERQASLKKRASLLDSVNEEFKRLQKTLGPKDRNRVDRYLQSVREVERRIQRAQSKAKERPLPDVDRPAGVPASYADHARLMFDLQLLALQGDITRVITFQLARETSNRTYPEIGVRDPHHPLTHHGNNPEKIAKVAKINRFHVSLFAEFLKKLKETPEGNGSLLDHSLYLYGSGMGNPNVHDHTNLPIIVAGGAAGNMQGGRHIRFKKPTPLANLHLTLLNKVGVKRKSFADSKGEADGMTALHWAAYHEDVKTAKQIIAAGGNAKPANRYGVTPLSIACKNGNAAIVQLLLQAGADPNTALPGGETALMTAARTGKPGPVKALLAAGAKVDLKERKGQTALMWAAAEGNVDVVDVLLEARADFRTRLPSGFTAFFFAVREGRTEAALRLLKAGVDVNAVMRTGKSPSKKRQHGTSAMLLAVENGHFSTAAALLKAGADANDLRAGYSALHAITWVRKPLGGDGAPPPRGSGKMTSLEFVKMLVKQGADVNARHTKVRSPGARLNRNQATPFLLAADTADLPLMKLLLKLGADPNLTNDEGTTPLLAATGVNPLGSGNLPAGTEDESIAAIKLLLKLGADINAVNKKKETAMHGAAYTNAPKMVQLLADSGADIRIWNRKNKRGWTPLLIAHGHRPGNFRPAPKTIAAVKRVMKAAGVEPPADPPARKPRSK